MGGVRGSVGSVLLSAALLLAAGVEEGAGGSSHSPAAHIQSEYGGQLVTSSTLAWQRAATGQALPAHWVEAAGGGGGAAVCRGKQQGTWFLGATDNGRCRVGFTSRLVSITSYEVLTSIPGASKLDWRPYGRFEVLPPGAVAGVEGKSPVFVARKLDEKGTMWPAVVEMPVSDYGFGSFKFFTQHDIVDTKDGDVLVEVEPVRYELHVDKFAKKPRTNSDRKILASASIFRFQEGREELARMQKMLTYSYEKSLHLSQLRGVIKGLPVRVHLPSGERKSLAWGVADVARQSESLMVGYDMTPNSAVDVVISAVAVEEEQPYAATLVAVFADESRRERRVEGGVMVTHYLDTIRPEYSPLYLIRDQVMANPPSAHNLPTKTEQDGQEKEEAERRKEEEEEEEVKEGGRQWSRSAPEEPGGGTGTSYLVSSSHTPRPHLLVILLWAVVPLLRGS